MHEEIRLSDGTWFLYEPVYRTITGDGNQPVTTGEVLMWCAWPKTGTDAIRMRGYGETLDKALIDCQQNISWWEMTNERTYC